MTLLFDTSSMQPEDVQKAADSAIKWVDEDMSTADLVAVASIGSDVCRSERLHERQGTPCAPCWRRSLRRGTALPPSTRARQRPTMPTQRGNRGRAVDVSAQELDTFNNDVRLRALKTLAEALTPIQQKKAIIYFSSGMQRSGSDNQIELRDAVNAAVRANVAIYPVDSRGLQAMVPGGSARQGSRGGVGAFSGRGVRRQFTQLAAQQETLTRWRRTPAAPRSPTRTISAKRSPSAARHLVVLHLGFSSTNPARDGRFRRLRVRFEGSGPRLEARNGYYADRDFAHTARTDRESLLQEQLAAPIPVTDVPVFVSRVVQAGGGPVLRAGLAGRPGSRSRARGKMTLDVAGFIRDERGAPVGRIRDTLTVPPASADTLAARQVLYQTGVTLPPGRFQVRSSSVRT